MKPAVNNYSGFFIEIKLISVGLVAASEGHFPLLKGVPERRGMS
jgi:hypothetical protein